MKKILALSLIFFLIQTTYGCACQVYEEYSNMERTLHWYNSFEYIFQARIDKVVTKEDLTSQTVHLTPLKIYKGKLPSLLVLTPPHFGSSCGFNLEGEEGRIYLVYGKIDEKGEINTHFCFGTRRIYTPGQLDTIKTLRMLERSFSQEMALLEAVSKEKSGEIKAAFSNGRPTCKGKFKKGIPVGYWEYYNYYGEKESEGSYGNGLKQGPWIEYRYRYEVKEVGKDRKIEIFLYEFSKGAYIDGLKEGVWIEYYPDGKYKSTETFEKGEWVLDR